MVKAFVFGKFLPFHKGHEAMIHFALTKCDVLSVLVCGSDKENIPSETRKKWIERTFASISKIEIRCFDYSENDLPNTSVSSLEVSKVWAERFKTFFPEHDLVITSEEYGDYVAAFMGIKHMMFDIPKQRYPVSATAIRSDLFTNWQFFPNSVKPYFAMKVVLLGTESTGKTTLAKRLSEHFNCSLVHEAGRDLINDSRRFEFDDLKRVALEHAQNIEAVALGDSPLIIIDTDIHITQSYAKFLFEKELPISNSVYNANKADLYLYLTNDVDYVQDGTRLNEKDRNLLDLSHRATLKANNIGFYEINGHWEERFKKAIALINALRTRKDSYSSTYFL